MDIVVGDGKQVVKGTRCGTLEVVEAVLSIERYASGAYDCC